jgi:hypothetical protein
VVKKRIIIDSAMSLRIIYGSPIFVLLDILILILA